MGRTITIFNLLGFRVQIDFSWLFLALLIVWSLSTAFFPAELPGYSLSTYWWMGVAGMIGLLFSLIFHELSHSLIARRYGLSIKGITLFIFGGVAEIADEPPSPKAEFWMSIAGPIASLSLAASFEAVASLGNSLQWPQPVLAVSAYLALLNVMLAAFNLVPAYPLDGGRVLRAILWWRKRDIRWATQRASQAGEGFGLFLIVLGVLRVLTGNFVGGMWLFLIGFFLQGAARSSYAQLVTREVLGRTTVSQFMTPNPIVVAPDRTVQELVESYIYRYHHEQFPVVMGARLLGSVGVREVKTIPREEWPRCAVGEIVTPCTNETCVDAAMDSARALALMSRTGNSRLIVTRESRLVGILTLKDLLRFISIKLDLEQSS